MDLPVHKDAFQDQPGKGEKRERPCELHFPTGCARDATADYISQRVWEKLQEEDLQRV